MSVRATYKDLAVTLHTGDALEVLRTLPAESVQCCITSPPYWGLRDYGTEGQLGLEKTPEEYVARMVEVFREVRRVLRTDGTLWLNIGDSYQSGARGGYDRDRAGVNKNMGATASDFHSAPNRLPIPGLKDKDLVGVPWRLAFALQADGWWLRADIIWAKRNCMPESVEDRPTRSHEYVFLLTKSARYFYDAVAIAEPIADVTERDRLGDAERTDRGYPGASSNGGGRLGASSSRNKRSVWWLATQPYPDAHFAVFPEDLVKPCVLAGTRKDDTVLDPFAGSGTALSVAKELRRRAIGIELNPVYVALAIQRLRQEVLAL